MSYLIDTTAHSQVADVKSTEHSISTSTPSKDDATTSPEFTTTLTETSTTVQQDDSTGKPPVTTVLYKSIETSNILCHQININV